MVEHLRAVRGAVPARRRRRFRRAAAAQLRAAARQRRRCASTTSARFRTSWSTSSRTPTRCSTRGCKLLAGPQHGAVFAVGDDDQSIYAFRGAQRRQHGSSSSATSSVARALIKLEQNYRSHGNILDAANALIANNRDAPRQEPVHRRRARASRCACTRPRRDFARGAVDRRGDQGAASTRGLSRSTRSRCSTAATRSRA